MTLAARQAKVATQMGNQARAGEGWRELCEMIWSNAIGGGEAVDTTASIDPQKSNATL